MCSGILPNSGAQCNRHSVNLIIGFLNFIHHPGKIGVYLSATVGMGLAPDLGVAAIGTRIHRENGKIEGIRPTFLWNEPSAASADADGWSKPHPYGGLLNKQQFIQLLTKADKHIP